MIFFKIMAFIESLTEWYGLEVQRFQTIPFVRATFNGTLTREKYIDFLKEYFHFVASAAPMYSLAASKIPPSFQRVREWFVKYAYKEMDHDQFILRDLEALGIPGEQTRKSKPSPQIDALIGYNQYFTEKHHPVGVLGTAFLMGKLSSAYSLGVAERLRQSLGLQEEGASFFFAHGHLDKEQPEDVGVIIQSVTEKEIQEEILFNAKTVFMLYQNFFASLK